MKILKILIGLLLVGAVAVAVLLWYAGRYLRSPAFKERVLTAARQAVGTDVQVDELDVSLLRGVTLRGVKVANPPGYDGSFLTAQQFVLRYKLWPLLRGQFHLQRVSVIEPAITLVRNAHGEWNYEKVGGTPAPTATTTGSRMPVAPPVDIVLSKLTLERGTILVVKEGGTELVRFWPVNAVSAVQLRGGRLSGRGQVRVETITCADTLFVRDVGAPLTITTEEIKLAPVRGRMAGGHVNGEVALKMQGGFKYVVQLQTDDGDVTTLLQEAGSKPLMSGKLRLTTALEGTGGLDTIRGNGRADIVGGRLMDVPALNLVATLLQISELRNLQFDECHVEFTIANNQVQTPVITVKSPQVELTGSGALSLADYTLDHNLTLAVAPALVAKVPKEIRLIFSQRPDGWLTLSFRVTGPYDSPRTDLKERLVKGAVGGLLQKLVR